MQTVGGRYALDGRLGEGGMGQVYRARHIQLGKAFALKLIAPAFAEDSDARARFNQEAKLASEISHPNIVSVVDFGEDATFGAYMVMELVEGEPLVAEGSLPMSVKRALDILAQVADALEHIHKRGIIHGDVKADNIMLSGENDGARRRRVARLLDFGLARRGGAHEEELSGGVSGSPHYLAPERASGGPPSVSTDIYALGVLAYLLFTGTLPFEGSVVEVLMAHIHEPPEQPSKRLGEGIDEAIEALILRAMAKDPSQRHGSAASFRYELNAVMEMLEMSRRRARGTGGRGEDTRESLVQQAFDRSRLPQALLSISGVIATANKSFAKLVGQDGQSLDNAQISETALMQFVPGLMRAIKTVHLDHKAIERRARVFRGADIPPLELIISLAPLPMPGCEVHMIIRVEEVDARMPRDDR
ncbi:MAG: serine/threonine protein kinase [Myxococcales bacterium]|nr:serine/threonine protein kinase [Myxococcales bacterium]